MAATDLDPRAAFDATQERVRDGFDELTDRASEVRDAVVDRYHDVEDDMDLERTVRRTRIQLWTAARTLLQALLVVPRTAVTVLGTLSTLVDRAVEVGGSVAEHTADASERGRELVEALPSSARERRRGRLRAAGWAGAGFGVGVGVGWILARRQATVVTYDAPYAIDGAPWNAVDEDAPGADQRTTGSPREPGVTGARWHAVDEDAPAADRRTPGSPTEPGATA